MEGEDRNNRLVNYRPLLFAAVGFILGAAFCRVCGGSIQLALSGGFGFASAAAVLAPAVMLALAILSAFKRRRWLLVLSAAFVLGFLRMSMASPDSLSAPYASVTGTVKSIELSGNSSRIVLSNAEANGVRLKYRILIKADPEYAEALLVGDRVEADCRDLRVPGGGNEYYDERLTRLSEGVSQRADAAGIAVVSRGGAPLERFFAGMRSRLESTSELVFGDDSALVSGFLLGQKRDIPDEVYGDLKAGGIAHLLSLSGFHVALLTAMLFAVLPKRRAWLRVLVVGLFLFVYCGMAGFPASLVRASVMCMCVLLAYPLERRPDPLSSISLAALIILLVNPYRLYSVGFRLSFAATVGIILAFSYGSVDPKRRVLRPFVEHLLVCVGATAGTMLISARYFGVFYTYNLLANLVCVPLFSAAVMMSFVLLAAGLALPGLCSVLAAVTKALFSAALWILDRITELPYSQLNVVRTSSVASALLLLALFASSAFVLRPMKKRMLYAGMLLLLFTSCLIADIIKI